MQTFLPTRSVVLTKFHCRNPGIRNNSYIGNFYACGRAEECCYAGCSVWRNDPKLCTIAATNFTAAPMPLGAEAIARAAGPRGAYWLRAGPTQRGAAAGR